eukprot:COSAG05_NODE_1098_length_5892_cov_50.569480_5_plen_132_part_00
MTGHEKGDAGKGAGITRSKGLKGDHLDKQSLSHMVVGHSSNAGAHSDLMVVSDDSENGDPEQSEATAIGLTGLRRWLMLAAVRHTLSRYTLCVCPVRVRTVIVLYRALPRAGRLTLVLAAASTAATAQAAS